MEILEFLYLVEKFLADIFQKFFDYDTKSESSGSESNEEEQETEQFDMDMAVAEEYIEYYADKYKK